MPATLTYPGVYVEEVPSGVRTITGVATSVTAFVGTAQWGPLDEATEIYNFSDFERQFGGLWVESSLGYAVRDFFLNGGGVALIVRIAKDAAPTTLTIAGAGAGGGGGGGGGAAAPNELALVAASPGEWGNALSVTIEPSAEPKTFNLIVKEKTPAGDVVVRESYLNVSTDETKSRYLPRVLEQAHALVRVAKDADGKYRMTADAPPAGDTAALADSGKNGAAVDVAQYTDSGKGINALDRADIFNLLVIPPPTRGGETPTGVYTVAIKYCHDHRAVLLVDPPPQWVTKEAVKPDYFGFSNADKAYAALYFPQLIEGDQQLDNQSDTFPPSGAMAGVIAKTDATRGVWKAPAGTDAGINGTRGLSLVLTDDENGALNPLGVNCLRQFAVYGRVVWGARTMKGADQLADEYKYLPVRRLALYIEESLFRGTKWVVFEPNDEPLWSQIRLNVGTFMHTLFRQGAFEGKTPAEAYFVKCDGETTTQADIDLGRVNIHVGFAPLKPAEFVVIQIQQIAGKLEA